jgi:hypothetical protein
MLVNDRFLTWNKNALNTYQVRINGRFFPEEPIVATGEGVQAYGELMRLLDKLSITGYRGSTITIDGDAFNLDRFAFPVDLNKFPNDSTVINPQSTLLHAAHLQMTIILTAPPAVAQALDSFVLHSVVAVLGQDAVWDRIS